MILVAGWLDSLRGFADVQELALAWKALPLRLQVLHVTASMIVLSLLALIWTPLGNRRPAAKCLAVAILLHLIAWQYLDYVDLSSQTLHPEPREARVPIQMPRRDAAPAARTPVTPLNDPRAESRQAPAEVPETTREETKQAPEVDRQLARLETPADMPARLETKVETPVPNAEALRSQAETPKAQLEAVQQSSESLAKADRAESRLPTDERLTQSRTGDRPDLSMRRQESAATTPERSAVRPTPLTPQRADSTAAVVRRQSVEPSPAVPRAVQAPAQPATSSPARSVLDAAQVTGEGGTVGRRSASTGTIARRPAPRSESGVVETPAVGSGGLVGPSSTFDAPSPAAPGGAVRPNTMAGPAGTGASGPLAAAPNSGSASGGQPGGGTPGQPGSGSTAGSPSGLAAGTPASSTIEALAGAEGTIGRRSAGGSGETGVQRRMVGAGTGETGDAVALALANRGNSAGGLTPGGLGGDVNVWRGRTAPNRLDIVFQHGGSLESEEAVANGLAWLAAHQSPEGNWDSDEFMRQCPDGDRCAGPAVETGSDTGLTGLSLLAFLGAGHTHLESDKHKETVRRGISYLMLTQRPDGDLRGRGRIYDHAMATLALTEAFAISQDQRLREPAQRGIDWLTRAQHAESGGWRYVPGQFGDTSVFGWAIMALRSGRNSGLRIDQTAWERSKRWLPAVTSGRSGGLACYQPGHDVSHAMTAEALVCKQVYGLPRTNPAMDEAGDYLLTKLPSVEDYHLYYWYYGTLSMFQLGGRHWKIWNESLLRTLIATQEKQGHARGSWTPKSPFGVDGGRVFSTACSVLCLEVYYRYLPLYATSGGASQ